MTSTSEVIYFTASQIIQQVLKRKGSIKSLCLSSKSENKKKLYALVSQSLKYQSILQSILSHSKLLEKERKLTKALAWVLLYDFLLSPRRSIQCGGRLKFTIKKYTSVLIKSLDNVMQIHQVSSVDQLLHSCPSFTLSFPRYVRVNTLKISLDEVVSLFKLEGWTFLGILQTVETNLLKTNTFAADPLLSTYVLVFPTGTDFHDHPLCLSGKLILQDKASCLPPLALAPPLHSHCIDACAAPGNKTSFLSQLLNNTGHITAFELHRPRYEVLQQRLEVLGCRNVTSLHQDFLTTDPSQFPLISHILVDPSCSGSGIHLEETEKINPKRLLALSTFQKKVIFHAMKFPHVQRIVYSTCSLHVEENEEVIHHILSHQSNFTLSNDLFPEWPTRGFLNTGLSKDDAMKVMRLNPKDHFTHGFFIAMFERRPDSQVPPFLPPLSDGPAPISKPSTSNPLTSMKSTMTCKKKKRKLKTSQRKSILDV